MIWQPVALLTLAQKSILLVRLYALVVFLSAAYLMFSTARLLRQMFVVMVIPYLPPVIAAHYSILYAESSRRWYLFFFADCDGA